MRSVVPRAIAAVCRGPGGRRCGRRNLDDYDDRRPWLPSRSRLPFLDREQTIARAGYSRWMVPPAALCVHLCIGQAYAFSVFNLPMTPAARFLGVDAGRLEADRSRLDIFDRDGLPRFVGGSVRALGRGGGPRKAMFTAGVCWASAFLISALGVYLHILAHLSRLRRDRRLRARHRLYLAGLDLDEVVSRSSGHGNRHGDHGIGGGALIGAPLSVRLMREVRELLRRRRALTPS